MKLRVGHGRLAKHRLISWYHPCEASALEALIRAAGNVPADRPFLLLDDTMCGVALSSSLPSGLTFELAVLPQPSAQCAVAVVDPISTGVVLCYQLKQRGYAVLVVWSDMCPDELKSFVDPRYQIEFAGRVDHAGDVNVTSAGVLSLAAELGVEVSNVMVGCETGVLLGDELSEALNCRTNGTAKSALRRDKWLQTEAVRAAKLDACEQALAHSASDVEAFLKESPALVKAGKFKAVVKPVDGAGSEGVHVCESPDEVRKAFASLSGTKNVLGLVNDAVLLQEYLRGDEYVVDTVSRGGVHKCTAIWKYDKRPLNNAPVVYYGMLLMPIDREPHLAAMVEYVLGVLEALGIQNGAIHSEVKMEERGPVLIEANCRMHGGEGTWEPMASAALGYSQVSAQIDAFLDPLAFAALPSRPETFNAYAREAIVSSVVSGVLSEIDPVALSALRSLPSYQSEMFGVTVGQPIEKTVDLITSCGNINLVHMDPEQLDADYRKLHEICEKGIFLVDSLEVPATPPAAAYGY